MPTWQGTEHGARHRADHVGLPSGLDGLDLPQVPWVRIVAVVLLIVGFVVQSLGFLMGVAPILLVVAVMLLLLNRSGGHRIPR